MSLDVPDSVQTERRPGHPDEKTGHIGKWDENQPKPEEDEDLFVEEIDGEDALDGVTVDAAQFPHFKVAKSHSGEAFTGRPVLIKDQLVKDLKSVHMIVSCQEGI